MVVSHGQRLFVSVKEALSGSQTAGVRPCWGKWVNGEAGRQEARQPGSEGARQPGRQGAMNE